MISLPPDVGAIIAATLNSGSLIRKHLYLGQLPSGWVFEQIQMMVLSLALLNFSVAFRVGRLDIFLIGYITSGKFRA